MESQYVLTNKGEYLAQVEDVESPWGFYLADEEQSWPGGFGIAASWKIIHPEKVPSRVRKRLGWLVER